MHTVLNYINGEKKPSASGKTLEQRNPADLTRVTCLFQDSTREDVKEAVAAAKAAFPAWAATPAPRRAEILEKALANIIARKDEIAEVITAENGKTIAESLGEINSAVSEMAWNIGEGRRLYGDVVPSANAGFLSYMIYQPLGVVSIISPWNFPFNVPGRKCVPALMAGNTVVFKPASLTPRVGECFLDAFIDAGLPAGVFNMVTGGGGTVGDEMTINPEIKAISFTGSTPVGMGIHRKGAEILAKTQMEMGGKNPMVVMEDADLDEAVNAAFVAAYACAGQWCTSTSRAIVVESVYDEFVEKLAARVKAEKKVGPGTDPATTMGPVCGAKQRDDVLYYIGKGIEEGARLVCGGRQVTEKGLDKGCFIAPTIFADVTNDMTIAREEIFGPVLSVIKVKDFDEAVAVANDTDFGLSSAIYTKSLSYALKFAEKTEAGLTHVNIPTAHKEPQLSFGGVKHSGAGLPESGKTGVEFFTRHKVVYIKY